MQFYGKHIVNTNTPTKVDMSALYKESNFVPFYNVETCFWS